MNILITGTARGIGRATAEYFLERGHEVHGMDILPAAIVHGHYHHHRVDVREPETFPADLQPQVVVNCAGVQDSGADLAVNLKGVINVTERYAVENEAVRAVVNVGSASGHTGAEFPEYAASKGGLLAYTKNVALRIAPHGAVCNSLDFGGVLTQSNKPVTEDPALWAQIMERTPLKRWMTEREAAEWAYFMTVTNRFCTGQNILIDGLEAGDARFIWPG